MYGLEKGETASPEHLEKCKTMTNLSFIDKAAEKEDFFFLAGVCLETD